MDVNKRQFLLFFLLGFVISANGQTVKITGIISDDASKERLIGAVVYDSLNLKGSTSNEYGYYAYTLKADELTTLKYSFVGYQPYSITLRALKDTTINIALRQVLMKELIVIGDNQDRANSVNNMKFTPAIYEYPKLNAEVDIIKIIQQAAGVQPGLEGSSGYSVRGGDNDQNLIVMDNIPIYNTGHLAGFVSIFDPFAINSMTLYKGGFPAQYGGRASSVLDIYLKEGNPTSYHGEFTLGILSSKAALEGPIVKDRSSFLVSYRRSILDLLLNGFYSLTKESNRFNYVFDDLTAKINFKLNQNNHIYLSVYKGADRLRTTGSSQHQTSDTVVKYHSSLYYNKWGNQSASIRWNHIFSNKVFYNATLAYSGFNYTLDSRNQVKENTTVATLNNYSYGSSVNDILFKSDFDIYFDNNSQIKAGLHLTDHGFKPVDWQEKIILGRGESETESANEVNLSAAELFGYVQGNFLLADGKVNFYPGLRAGHYFLENEEGFTLVEPRLSLKFGPDKNSNWQADYTVMNQTVHSLNTSGTSLTSDIWLPVTQRLKPSRSDQVSLAYNRIIPSFSISVQSGIYYKWMNNLIDYNGNLGFTTIRGEWDEAIASGGKGQSYGFELMADKEFTNFFLSGNYTYSRSTRTFEEINDGATYPQNFDRPHNITLSSVIRLSKKINISALWTYQSGQPLTLGDQVYAAINNHEYVPTGTIRTGNPNLHLNDPNYLFFEDVLIVDQKNNYRMPDYHRMDVAVNFKKQWKNGWNREFSVSVYNAYNRKNAYFIYTKKNNDQLTFHKFTLFPILPTVSYALKF